MILTFVVDARENNVSTFDFELRIRGVVFFAPFQDYQAPPAAVPV